MKKKKFFLTFFSVLLFYSALKCIFFNKKKAEIVQAPINYMDKSNITQNFCLEYKRLSQEHSNLCAWQMGMSHGYLCIRMCFFFNSSVSTSVIEREVHSNFSRSIIVKFLTNKNLRLDEILRRRQRGMSEEKLNTWLAQKFSKNG